MNTPMTGSRSPASRIRALSRALLATLLLIPLAGCSGSDGTTNPVGTESMVAVEGLGVRAPAGTVVPQGPTVEVRDGRGEPVAGARVSLVVLDGGGRVGSPTLETDARGRASGIWVLGREAGSPQKLLVTWGRLAVEFTAEAVVPDPARVYQGRSGYVDYYPGTLPLVLTAPHGGSLEPPEIPDRGWGVTAQDRNTRELTLAIRDAIFLRTGAYPHVILSNLHRRKLDPNREIVEAAQGNRDAERAWWEFQVFADEAGDLVEDAFGRGLHLDIHGHAHDIPRLEVGYLLSGSDLAASDETLSGATYVNRSSVRALATLEGNDLASILRGPNSLGSLMEDRLVPAVPSANQPGPGQESYFTGGYNTVRHGSRDGGEISGIQIEHHYPGLRDTEEHRTDYAGKLADALLAYFPALFKMALEAPHASGK